MRDRNSVAGASKPPRLFRSLRPELEGGGVSFFSAPTWQKIAKRHKLTPWQRPPVKVVWQSHITSLPIFDCPDAEVPIGGAVIRESWPPTEVVHRSGVGVVHARDCFFRRRNTA